MDLVSLLSLKVHFPILFCSLLLVRILISNAFIVIIFTTLSSDRMSSNRLADDDGNQSVNLCKTTKWQAKFPQTHVIERQKKILYKIYHKNIDRYVYAYELLGIPLSASRTQFDNNSNEKLISPAQLNCFSSLHEEFPETLWLPLCLYLSLFPFNIYCNSHEFNFVWNSSKCNQLPYRLSLSEWRMAYQGRQVHLHYLLIHN